MIKAIYYLYVSEIKASKTYVCSWCSTSALHIMENVCFFIASY